jgi:hypothetical protein
MHYIGNRAITTAPQDAEEECTHEHDVHLELHKRMHHPIAFHAEMMGESCTFIRHFNNRMLLNLSKL